MRLWLGNSGEEILLPRYNLRFQESDSEITREGRTASGRLVIDVAARKKTFTLSYGTLDNESYETLKAIYSINNIMSFKVERSNEIIEIYEVRMKPFSRQRLLLATRWYWDGITIVLEEI